MMKLGEVCLLTGDVNRLASFYRRLLELPEGDGSPVHQLLIQEEPMLAVYNDGQPHSADRSPVTLAFTVEDIDAAHEKLLSMNAVIVDPPTKRPWGATNMSFRDPDGNLVYLRSFPK